MHRLWLFTAVVVLTLGPSWGRPADAAECGAWNTREFFKLAPPVRVRACLAVGADPTTRDKEGATPLHYAAESTATPAVITALVTAGADPTTRDKEGATPLHVAARFNQTPAVLTALVAAGADLAARDKNGQLPQDLAQDNAALKGTDAWWRLNEGRF